ncbi:MAG: ribbon-helix-helix protein, CopG family [Deltaproteobacteria bacterium]|nr:ribbon-helix-helix protein, CopG family [Deltaproteobacteria bacterium]
MRTIIDIPDADIQRLSSICKAEGISRAEAVRRAVKLYLEGHLAGEGEAFGLWKDRDIDALEYERALREEWR